MRARTLTKGPTERRALGAPLLGFVAAAAVLLAIDSAAAAASAGDGFAASIAFFHAGAGAGFGQDRLPGVVFGAPRGGGDAQGSLDVLSLGHGGEIALGFGGIEICDGPGVDFLIFENAFRAGGGQGAVFAEVGLVAASADGVDFVEFPYDVFDYSGLAGVTPVYSNPDNGIDPFDPAVAGGDGFDLATLGLGRAAFVRITDAGDAIDDPGNHLPPGTSGGFDLDAVAVVHICPTAATPSPTLEPTSPASPTPTATQAEASPTATETPPPVSSPTSTETLPQATPTSTETPLPVSSPTMGGAGDVDGDGDVDAADLSRLIAEIFDGDGEDSAAVAGGDVFSSAAAETNGDARVDAADLVGWWQRR